MNIEISKSNKSDKKLKAVIDGKKTIHFGAKTTASTQSIKTQSEKQII